MRTWPMWRTFALLLGAFPLIPSVDVTCSAADTPKDTEVQVLATDSTSGLVSSAIQSNDPGVYTGIVEVYLGKARWLSLNVRDRLQAPCFLGPALACGISLLDGETMHRTVSWEADSSFTEEEFAEDFVAIGLVYSSPVNIKYLDFSGNVSKGTSCPDATAKAVPGYSDCSQDITRFAQLLPYTLPSSDFKQSCLTKRPIYSSYPDSGQGIRSNAQNEGVESAHSYVQPPLDFRLAVEWIDSTKTMIHMAIGNGVPANTRPAVPSRPVGIMQARPNINMPCTSEAIDWDGDVLYYRWDWGDGEFSDWLGPLESGTRAFASHIWADSGNYNVRVKVRDPFGEESEWSSPLPVSINTNPDLNLGMADPSAVYCVELGYKYRTDSTSDGEIGVCVFPDGSSCSSWAFLRGSCGETYSYCARNNYRQIVKTDGKEGLTPIYAVCADSTGEVGSVSELSGAYRHALKSASRTRETGHRPERGSSKSDETVTAPNSFTWRNYNGGDWTTPVKNQGICGSCWAFSAVGVTEAIHNIRNNNPSLDLDLSEQYLVSDCLYHEGGYNNCCGGYKTDALQLIRTEGIPDEACMPYVDGTSNGCTCGEACDAICTYSTGGSCSDRTCSDRCSNYAGRLKRISGYNYVTADAAQIMQAVYDKGPLAVSVGIGSDVGGSFDGEIYRCANDTMTNHAVIIVGYNYTGSPGTSYWIVRNSYGTDWPSSPNDGGYYKVGFNECSIQDYVYAVTLDICGNGICEASETCATCYQDCHAQCYCGDGICNNGETCASCSADCGSCCGDGICNYGETCGSCYQDCKSQCYCGDGICNNGETCLSCSTDCGLCCGDGACNYGETCKSCPWDCGQCPYCGDGVCNRRESSCSCKRDCPGICEDCELISTRYGKRWFCHPEEDICGCQKSEGGVSNEVAPTGLDLGTIIDAFDLPISFPCLAAADINLSGGANPGPDDITIGDVVLLLNTLFVAPEQCCIGRVGNVDGSSDDEPTIGDVSVMIDAKFITGTCDGILSCLTEADINQSGGTNPTCDDITIGDISMLIDYLFITGPSLGLPECM